MRVLLRSHQRKYAVMGDITQLFHEVRVLPCDRIQIFMVFWRKRACKDLNVHLFSQTDSPNCSNRDPRKIASDHCEKLNAHVANAVLNKVCMNEYLDSIDNLNETITTILDVTRLLAFDGFNLDKLIQIIATF